MNDLLNEQTMKYLQYAFWFIFSSGVVCEIVPIKFSPISMMLGWIGKKLNRDMKKDIDKLQEEVVSVRIDLRDHKVDSWRNSILSFADDLMRGEHKSREGFEFIIRTHDNYEEYLKLNKLDNGQVTLAYEYIKDCYQDCMKNNSFYYGK